MDDGTVEGGFANANCDAFDAGAVSIDAYAWSSAPRDAMLRVGIEARADRGARETYASVLIANDVDREVNEDDARRLAAPVLRVKRVSAGDEHGDDVA